MAKSEPRDFIFLTGKSPEDKKAALKNLAGQETKDLECNNKAEEKKEDIGFLGHEVERVTSSTLNNEMSAIRCMMSFSSHKYSRSQNGILFLDSN